MICRYGQMTSMAVMILSLTFQAGCFNVPTGGGNGGDGGGQGMNGMDGNDGMDGNNGMDGMDGMDGMNGGPVSLTPIKTNIDVHNGGRIAVGDDLLVYGYGGFAGVDYIIPSEGDTEGRGLPNGDSYVAGSFAVAGRKIALVSNFLITVFDTETLTGTDISEDDIRLVNTPSGIYSQGHPTADGNYIACRNDPSSNGGNRVMVIDVSEQVPTLISFSNDPDTSVSHIAIDADERQLAAAAGDSFYIYDIDNPDASPTVFDVSDEGGIGGNIFSLDGGYVFYEDDEAFGNARFLDVSDGTLTTLTQNPSAGEQCHNGGEFVYFVDRDANDSNGSDSRSGIGTVPGPGASLAGDMEIDGSTTNNGFFGWSQACSITPNGNYTFLSGTGSIGSGEFLQVSTGGAFSLLADPDGSSQYGLPGTDVTTSSTLVGFKTGDGTTAGASTKVGYIILSN